MFERLRHHYNLYANFLSSRDPRSSFYKYAFSIINSYTAYQEVPETAEGWKSFFLDLAKLARAFAKFPTRAIQLSETAPTILLSIHPPIDEPVARTLKIPIVRVTETFPSLRGVIHNISRMPLALYVMITLLTRPGFSRRHLIKSFTFIFDFILHYECLDQSGIRQIITHRDRYPDEIGMLLRARELGVQTIKIDHYPLDPYAHTTTVCQYYFIANKMNQAVFEAYPQNDWIIYQAGGFPSWDRLANYAYSPIDTPKVVLFISQYWSEHFSGTDNRFYIREILQVLPEGFQLWIKVHPLEKSERYAEFKNKGVRIIAQGESDNYSLISQATFCFSMYSALSYEAKHICNRSFLINYHPERLAAMDYKHLTNFIDHVKNSTELREVLSGARRPLDQNVFIQRFNPHFPETCSTLATYVKHLAATVPRMPTEEVSFPRFHGRK